MRIYEQLWNLPSCTLTRGPVSPSLAGDAALGARLIRSYASDWIRGSGRFAALFLPYLLEMGEQMPSWLDALTAGSGGMVPEGMAETEADEWEGAIHPAEDPLLSGIPTVPSKEGSADTRAERNPNDYRELMKSIGLNLPEEELTARYYRERSNAHLIRFPTRAARQAADPLPEGLDPWDIGSPVSAIDWVESLVRSPIVIPGYTTLERSYGEVAGFEVKPVPLDLYLGVDCSGSMPNPAFCFSYPVLAGTVLLRSALRAGARVMVCLSGEPGKYTATDSFTRDESKALER